LPATLQNDSPFEASFRKQRQLISPHQDGLLFDRCGLGDEQPHGRLTQDSIRSLARKCKSKHPRNMSKHSPRTAPSVRLQKSLEFLQSSAREAKERLVSNLLLGRVLRKKPVKDLNQNPIHCNKWVTGVLPFPLALFVCTAWKGEHALIAGSILRLGARDPFICESKAFLLKKATLTGPALSNERSWNHGRFPPGRNHHLASWPLRSL